MSLFPETNKPFFPKNKCSLDTNRLCLIEEHLGLCLGQHKRKLFIRLQVQSLEQQSCVRSSSSSQARDLRRFTNFSGTINSYQTPIFSLHVLHWDPQGNYFPNPVSNWFVSRADSCKVEIRLHTLFFDSFN